MSNLPKIEISTEKVFDGIDCTASFGLSVKIDGNKIKGVQSADIHLGKEEFPTVTIELCGEVDIDKIRGIPNVNIIDRVELCKGEISDKKIITCTGLTDRQWSAEKLSGLE